jgi:hypothetical protein
LKTKNNKNKVLCFFITCFGLLFLIIGIVIFAIFNINFVRLKEIGIKTDGIISSIYSSGDNIEVFITFKTNDGNEITTRIDHYISNMYTGKNIKLYYDPKNPNKVALISSNFSLFFLLLFGGIGSVFFIIGIVYIKKNSAFEKHRDRLILSGNYVIADIIEVNKNTNITLFGENPYIIHSHYYENGLNYFFKSHDIWFEPSYFLSKKVRIYLDRNDYKKYYIDENSLGKN